MSTQPRENHVVWRPDQVAQNPRDEQPHQNEKSVFVKKSELHRDARRQQRHQNLPSVKRRNRQHVEHREQHIQRERLENDETEPIASGARSSTHRRGSCECNHHVAERARSRHENVIAPGLPQIARVDRRRLSPSDQRRARHHRNHRQQQRADGIYMDDGIQRDTAETPGGVVAELARRPRMRRLVNAQREDQNQQSNDESGNVRVRQRTGSITGYRPLPAKYPSTASAVFAPTTAVNSSRDARRTPARLPNATSSAFLRRGPTPGTLSSSDRRSRIVLALR